MTTDWLETTPVKSLTRAQVSEARLPAWTRADRSGVMYDYDGRGYLRRSGREVRRVAESTVPEIGWHHGPGCGCSFCRATAA